MARLIQRAHALLVILGITLSNFLFCPGFAFPNGDNYYSTLQEFQTCDHIIPKFIEQVMNQDSPKCDETGAFPKPGNCTVFFKCIRSKAFIQPFVEYCALGYNFVGGVCLPNTNSSDCPQYTCRIPDISGVNEIASDDTKPNYNDDVIHPVDLVPLETPPTASPISEAISETATSTNKTPQKPESNHGTVHSEQLMSATQKEKNSGSSSFSITIQFIVISSTLSLFLK
ncbi:hypothetical protein Ocin01_00797 [Orchesella cincta]|uniref:Chitin-binding type-2 domain-containing protein n=1 Tax=Orchesella cincta TaxID=48709 RepID=A0A1D2NL18_ORCCI|nr:hypothetical protein Ocin01_00797 [Orchesella cincta]